MCVSKMSTEINVSINEKKLEKVEYLAIPKTYSNEKCILQQKKNPVKDCNDQSGFHEKETYNHTKHSLYRTIKRIVKSYLQTVVLYAAERCTLNK